MPQQILKRCCTGLLSFCLYSFCIYEDTRQDLRVCKRRFCVCFLCIGLFCIAKAPLFRFAGAFRNGLRNGLRRVVFVGAAPETGIEGRRGPYNTLCAEVGTTGRRFRIAFCVLINRGVATDILGLNA